MGMNTDMTFMVIKDMGTILTKIARLLLELASDHLNRTVVVVGEAGNSLAIGTLGACLIVLCLLEAL